MKRFQKTILTALILLLFTAGLAAQELSLDQVLANYLKASNFSELQKVRTIIQSGTIFQSSTMPLKITRVRPDKYRMDRDVQDIPMCQAYDGKIAWEILTPWTHSEKAQPMSDGAANDIKMRADFEGALVNWEEKGHKAELCGMENWNNLQLYKIKLTRSDAEVEYYFIDSKDFLLRKKSRNIISDGKSVENVSLFSDYREVDGIRFPYLNENFMDGQPFSTVEYETIELNKPVGEKIFSMP